MASKEWNKKRSQREEKWEGRERKETAPLFWHRLLGSFPGLERKRYCCGDCRCMQTRPEITYSYIRTAASQRNARQGSDKSIFMSPPVLCNQ